MARTTPAQKPRGEHSITSRTGLASGELGVFSLLFMSPDPTRTWPGHGPAGSPCQGRPRPRGLHKRACIAYIIVVFPSSPMTCFARLASEAQRRFEGNSGDFIGDSAHGDAAADAESHRRLVGRKYRAVVRPDCRF